MYLFIYLFIDRYIYIYIYIHITWILQMQWGKEANEETAGNLSGFALLSMHNDEKMSSQWVSP